MNSGKSVFLNPLKQLISTKNPERRRNGSKGIIKGNIFRRNDETKKKFGIDRGRNLRQKKLEAQFECQFAYFNHSIFWNILWFIRICKYGMSLGAFLNIPVFSRKTILLKDVEKSFLLIDLLKY